MSLVSKTLFALSWVLYVVALLNNGYYIEGSNPGAWASAWGLLLMGWMGLFTGVFAWLANPLLLVGWMLLALRLTQAATICTIGAILCIGSFLLHDSILIDEAGGKRPNRRIWRGVLAVALKRDRFLCGLHQSCNRGQEIECARPLARRESRLCNGAVEYARELTPRQPLRTFAATSLRRNCHQCAAGPFAAPSAHGIIGFLL
jgi:hypothetical protein